MPRLTCNHRKIADEAFAALNRGAGQVLPFSTRYPAFSLNDAYRVTALANNMRIAQRYKPLGRKIVFTNRRMWDEYGIRAPIWGYVYDRTMQDLAVPLPLAAGEIVASGTLTRALPVKAGETWTTKLNGIGLEGISLRFC